jgi:hypothetical protein
MNLEAAQESLSHMLADGAKGRIATRLLAGETLERVHARFTLGADTPFIARG